MSKICPSKIKLTKGQFALVDDKDYSYLDWWKWHAVWCPSTKSYYAMRSQHISGSGKKRKKYCVPMHREIVGLCRGDKRQVDHKNHNTLDNRRCNLRIVTVGQNALNRREVRGFYWCNRERKFIANITVGGRKKQLGSFSNENDASLAYQTARRLRYD